MRRYVIIGDDLTGCNATSILFRDLGWPVTTLVNHSTSPDLSVSEAGVLVWNSASRLLPEGQAVSRLREMLRTAGALESRTQAWWGKRIDSTMRGHVVPELETMLDELPHVSAAVVVAAFPASGRTVVDGQLLVDGVPVDRTEIGHDRFSPVRGAGVCQMLRSQTNRVVRYLPLDALLAERERTQAQVSLWLAQGTAPIVVCDAAADADIEGWAAFFAACEGVILPVDPGPFTVAYMAAKQRQSRRVLVVSGSLMPTTARQLDVLESSGQARILRIDPIELCSEVDGKRQTTVVVEQVLGSLREHSAVGLRTDLAPRSEEINPSDGLSIAHALAEATVQILRRAELEGIPFHGLYVSGGEVAYETLSALEAHLLEPVLQVCPLGVLSRVCDGPHRGLHVVTKGGSVGDEYALVNSVQLLLSGVDETMRKQEVFQFG